jgi:hypothetical protein
MSNQLTPEEEGDGGMENKRYEYRTPVTVIVDHVQVQTPEPALAPRGYIREMSASGCQLESPVPLVAGQMISLSFILPGGHTIVNARAEVIRVLKGKKHAPLVACQFVKLPEIDQYKIREFIVWKEAHPETKE